MPMNDIGFLKNFPEIFLQKIKADFFKELNNTRTRRIKFFSLKVNLTNSNSLTICINSKFISCVIFHN